MENTERRDRAIELLKGAKGWRKQIERETEVTYTWIAKMIKGEINNPGTLHVESVLNWFKKKGNEIL